MHSESIELVIKDQILDREDLEIEMWKTGHFQDINMNRSTLTNTSASTSTSSMRIQHGED